MINQRRSRLTWLRQIPIRTMIVLCLLMGIACLPLASGIQLIRLAARQTAAMEAAAALQPQSAPAAQRAPLGEPVILIGQIEPREPIAEGDYAVRAGYPALLLYDLEAYTKLFEGSGSKKREVWRWENRLEARPPFVLVIHGERLDISNGDYDLVRHAFVSPVPADLRFGEQRYSGFNIGDTVLVYGKQGAAGMEASVVFGGSQEAFVALYREAAAGSAATGKWVTALGVLLFAIVIGAYWLHRWFARRRGPTRGRRAR